MARLLIAAALMLASTTALAGNTQDEAEAKDKDKAAGMYAKVKMETSLGDIVLELDAEKAPITVMNFIKYAEDKFYDGTVFHRVMSNFMIQGGGFTTELDQKKEGLRSPIKNEWTNGLKNMRGTIAMARTNAPDSATAQFFINVVDNVRLDTPRGGAAYCVFGKVVEGMDTVEKIRNTEVSTNAKYQSPQPVVPVEPVVIKSVTVIGDFDRAAVEAKFNAVQKELEEARAKAEKEANEARANAEKEQAVQLAKIIEDLKTETGSEPTTTASGLMYADLVVGEGETPGPTDTVEVHYTGWLTNDTKFDSSVDRGTPFSFSLRGGVIKGWLEGVASMKVGGKRKLIIPPDLAYGAKGRPSIPAYSTLVFEVELLAIK